jgi:hypothetical protein
MLGCFARRVGYHFVVNVQDDYTVDRHTVFAHAGLKDMPALFEFDHASPVALAIAARALANNPQNA